MSVSARALQMRTSPAEYVNRHTRIHKLARLAWGIVYWILFRPSPLFLLGLRRWLLRRFGARIGNAWIHPSVHVYAPWKLEIGDESFLGPGVNVYNDFGVRIGDRVVVSQEAFLCTASHDYTDPIYSLIGRPITVEDDCWIAAQAFVGPGVTVHQGAVVGARAVVVKDVVPWTVVAGNPARTIKQRILRMSQNE